ncbi:MAG: PmoA family protein [Balneolaceae bacterium]
MISLFRSAGFVLALVLSGCTENGGSADEAAAGSMSDAENQEVTLLHNEEEQKVDVHIGGEFFTSYLYEDTYYKPILYPILSAANQTITRGFPIDPRPGESSDHPHQAGLWLNYGDVNGLDFWNHSDRIPEDRKSSYGTICHQEIAAIQSGGDVGELDVVMHWMSPEDEILLVENTQFRFSGSEHRRVIDRITRLTAAEQDISLTDNKEGMIGIRMTRELEHPDEHDAATGIYRSSEGDEGNDVWGTRAKWMNLSGEVDGEPVSVAILDHPENVGYPTYWHARGYGLYAANPLGMREMSGGVEELDYQLAAGESITFRYRIIIYSGEEVSDDMVEGEWVGFVQ